MTYKIQTCARVKVPTCVPPYGYGREYFFYQYCTHINITFILKNVIDTYRRAEIVGMSMHIAHVFTSHKSKLLIDTLMMNNLFAS